MLHNRLIYYNYIILSLITLSFFSISLKEQGVAQTPVKSLPLSEFAWQEQLKAEYGGLFCPSEYLLKGYPEFWGTYNLDIKHTLYSSGAEANEALLSGTVDFNCGSETKTISLFIAAEDKGTIEPLIIGTIERGNLYSTIIPINSNNTSWMDLVGKTIGYRVGTGTDTIMRRYFNSDPDNLMLSFEDFTWQSMNVEDMPAALKARQVDAFTAWEPIPAIALDQRIGKVLRSYGDIALSPVSIHTTVEFATEHPDIVTAFLAAHLDKEDMINKNISEATEYAYQTASQLGSSLSESVFYDLFQRIDYKIDFNETIIEEILATADFLKNEVDPPRVGKIPTLRYDRQYLEAAEELRNNLSSITTSSKTITSSITSTITSISSPRISIGFTFIALIQVLTPMIFLKRKRKNV